MPTLDPRVDAYIDRAAPFAQPLLRHLRALVHTHCPEVQETIKWGMPYFEYHGLLCNMAAFKQHCAFGFWHPALRTPPHEREAMGQFGRLRQISDLPGEDEWARLFEQAMRLNRERRA